MTEQEWLACTDPAPMLRYLHGKASDRKLRLFIANYCRHNWHLFRDERCRNAIEIAELFADGQVDETELSQVYVEMSRIWMERFPAVESEDWQSAHVTPATHMAGLCRRAVRRPGRITTRVSGMAAMQLVFVIAEGIRNDSLQEAEGQVQVDFLCDIFGPLPFRPVAINPAWLAWNDGTVRKIAQSIYQERAFDRMPILADAGGRRLRQRRHPAPLPRTRRTRARLLGRRSIARQGVNPQEGE